MYWGQVLQSRIKIIARRNLKMTPGKLAAQSVHAALGLASRLANDAGEVNEMANLTTVVLEYSDQKYRRALIEQALLSNPVYIFKDAGYTEVEAETETCAAFMEFDPKGDEHDKTEEREED